MRKFRWRSAACAVPRWNGTSPSTSASSNSSRASLVARLQHAATLPSSPVTPRRKRQPKYGVVPITCSSRRRASSSSVTPSSSRNTSSVCCPSVGAGPRPVARGPGRHAHRPRRVLLRADVADGRSSRRTRAPAAADRRASRSRAPSRPPECRRRAARRPPLRARASRTTRRARSAASDRTRRRPRPTRRRRASRYTPPVPAPVEQRPVDRVADHLLGGDRGRDFEERHLHELAVAGARRDARARRRSRAPRARRPSDRPARRG